MVGFDPQMLAFTGLITALIVTPGANTMLITRNVLTRGQRAGLVFIAGGCMGVCLHAALSICGLSLVLVRCAAAYQTVKLMGAIYLIYLGCHSIRRVFCGTSNLASFLGDTCVSAEDKPSRKSFLEGFVSIILSPETSVFYLAVLPQFISQGESVLQKSLILASIHITIRVVWYSLLTIFVSRMTTMLKRPQVHRWLDLTTGGILVFLGFKVAVARS